MLGRTWLLLFYRFLALDGLHSGLLLLLRGDLQHDSELLLLLLMCGRLLSVSPFIQ